MNVLKLALTTAALAISASAAAQGVSYNIGMVSLYKSNGVDQTTNAKSFRPALQGGIDYDFGNGFYVGNWNSTVTIEDANVEIDLYAGFANTFANGMSVDAGVARYIYPDVGVSGWNSNEAYVSLGYGVATFKATRGLTDGANKKFSRYSLTLSQPLSEQLSVKLVLGDRNKRAGGSSDFGIGADYDMGNGMTVSGLISGAGKPNGSTKPDNNKTRLVVGLSQSF